MNLQFAVALFLVMFTIASSSGCMTAKQTWSNNLALADGAKSNDPAIIDGNVRTLGQSQYVETTGDAIMGFAAQSEAIIMLPAPESIHRIVIHSPNLLAFDIWTTDTQGRWEKVKEVESNKKKVIDIRLNRTVYTSAVKIRVRRTSDDAGQRRKNVRNVRGWQTFSGHVKAPAKIAEIELYGFVSESDKTEADSHPDIPVLEPLSASDDEELDEIDLYLK